MFYQATIENGEIIINCIEQIPEDHPCPSIYKTTKLEALAALGKINWDKYDYMKKQYDLRLAEILEIKDKIYRKILEVVNTDE